ncbi:LacI family DNA-binding transcriptional regulator [Paenibacillus sp. FSL R10-2734]|uniref:LacI family DNA-binding transcriptional regulator n=1 Tax=Paenibacillus sp. FSL R10-2734 TaxID=2954691 RepID=UPI0030DA299C
MKMEDIAKLANVSKAAVSLAFNGKPGIGQETRDRILQIAAEAGYTPKIRASAAKKVAEGSEDLSKSSVTGLQHSNNSLVFLVCTNSGIVLEEYYQQPFFQELIQFIEERCRQKGYHLMYSKVNMEYFEQEIEQVGEHNRNQGVIVLGTNLSRQQIYYIQEQLPNVVVLDTCYDEMPVQFVGINNMMGAYQAGTFLCQTGHKSIGYIASSVRIHNFEERERGFQAALKEHGVVLPAANRLSVAPTILTSQESLKRQLEAIIDRGEGLPTAWFCECDYIAISAMKTMAELGVRVPEDTSIIGFDNIKESVIVTPELTTIHVDKERMAVLAVDMLADSIEKGLDVKSKIKVDTTFIERKSCISSEK